MSKKKVENEQFFATSMGDMGGNIGDTPQNEVVWEETERDSQEHESYSHKGFRK